MVRFGPKRKLLDAEFPKLCVFYDDYVYNNVIVNNHFENNFYIDKPIQSFLKEFGMSGENLTEFKTEVLKYSKKNLVKITAYIEKVFAAQYITDQVTVITKCYQKKSSGVNTPAEYSHSDDVIYDEPAYSEYKFPR